jgi:ribose transport system permease protein
MAVLKEDIKKNPIIIAYNYLKKTLRKREFTILIPLLAMITFVGILNSSFFKYDNLISISRSIAIYGTIALGMTYVIIAGQIDISVGSIVGLTCAAVGTFMNTYKMDPLLASFLAVLIGSLVGIFNGAIIISFNMPAMVATLGTMFVARGFVFVITQAKAIYNFPEAFKQFGLGDVFWIPYTVIIYLVLAIIMGFILKHTVYGREVLAVGGNSETAWISGINAKKIKFSVYVLSGLMSGIGGIMLALRVGSSQPNAGEQYEMTVIAATIAGGTSMVGGAGSILGTVLGTVLLGMLTNVMVMLKIDIYWQKIVMGLIIIIAVAMDEFRRRSAVKRKSV